MSSKGRCGRQRTGVRFFITGARSLVRRTLRQHDVRPPRVVMRTSVQASLESIHNEKTA